MVNMSAIKVLAAKKSAGTALKLRLNKRIHSKKSTQSPKVENKYIYLSIIDVFNPKKY